jgi:hypothetical protein
VVAHNLSWHDRFSFRYQSHSKKEIIRSLKRYITRQIYRTLNAAAEVGNIELKSGGANLMPVNGQTGHPPHDVIGCFQAG